MILIGSSAHPELNQLVSDRLGVPLAPCKLGKFQNDETQVGVNVSVRGQNVYIITTGYAPINDNLMEALMIAKACKMSNAESITMILPFYPYCRQDKKTRSRECITSALVADMIQIAGVDRVITWCLHSEQTQGVFRIPLDNIRTDKLFGKFLKEKFPEIAPGTHIVVAPDAGATKRCRNLAMYLGLKMALIEKSRNYENGDEIENMMLIDKDNSVKGKIAIIYDDIGDTFGTLIKACTILQDSGAKEVYAVLAHVLMSGDAIKKANDCPIITKIIGTNSVPLPTDKVSKLVACDISSSIALAIECLEKKSSMSIVFD
jgi:ribose-phosphate pyrophosphokinase